MALEGGPGKYKGIRQAQGVSGGEKGRRTHGESQWPSAGHHPAPEGGEGGEAEEGGSGMGDPHHPVLGGNSCQRGAGIALRLHQAPARGSWGHAPALNRDPTTHGHAYPWLGHVQPCTHVSLPCTHVSQPCTHVSQGRGRGQARAARPAPRSLALHKAGEPRSQLEFFAPTAPTRLHR